MVSLVWVSLLALPAAVGTSPTTQPQPLALKDSRFHYAVGALMGPATARTLVVQPAQGKRTPHTIMLTGPAAQEPAENIVIRDVNFDGQPDLMITTGRGNVNSQYAYWLYDAPTQRFVLNPLMSNTLGGSQVTFDAATKHIVTASRFSCCEYETRTYAFESGKLKLLKTKTDKVTAQPTN